MKRTEHYISVGIIILVVIAFAIFAMQTSMNTNTVSNIQSQTIADGTFGGNVEKGNYVITDSVRWRELWLETYQDRSPIPEVPEVDFSKETVVAVYQGQRFTGGYDIQINEIRENDLNVEVYVTEYSPGENCIVTQQLTSPFHIMKMPRTEKSIGFIVEQRIIQCA